MYVCIDYSIIIIIIIPVYISVLTVFSGVADGNTADCTGNKRTHQVGQTNFCTYNARYRSVRFYYAPVESVCLNFVQNIYHIGCCNR